MKTIMLTYIIITYKKYLNNEIVLFLWKTFTKIKLNSKLKNISQK